MLLYVASISVPSCCTFSPQNVCQEKIVATAIFLLFLKNGSLFSLKCKSASSLGNFPFGEKIGVNENPSNPRAHISLDEWL